MIELAKKNSLAWLLATNGYWADDTPPGTAPQDDCSHLRLGDDALDRNRADSPNLILLEGSSAAKDPLKP